MKQVNVKKLILPNIPYVFIALLATKVSEAVRLAPGSDASTKLLNIMTGLNTAFHSLVPSFHPIDLCVGVAAAIAIRLAVYIKGKNAKKFRKNLEYGSARWGTAEDIKPYVDPELQEVHALQPVRLHPLGKGHFEAGHDADRQHQGRGQGR